MESVIRMFRERLFEAFFDWVEINKEAIGEKWYAFLYNEGKDAEAECDSALKIVSVSLWMFNMVANCGVLAGIGPADVKVHEINENLDKASTMRLLHLISACMCLQGLPKELATQEIPIISSKKFSLTLWTRERHNPSSPIN